MQNAMKDMDSFESQGIPPPPPRPLSALRTANGSADQQPTKRSLTICCPVRTLLTSPSLAPATPDTSVDQSKTQTTVKKSTVAGLSRHQSLGSLPTDGSPGTSKPSRLPQRSTFSALHVTSTPSKPSSMISEADRESSVSRQFPLLTLL